MNNLWLNCLLLSISLALFTRGFLLMRLEIDRKTSPCENSTSLLEETSIGSCQNTNFKFDKLVILIIDALRYDFASYDEDRPQQMIFHNKMPIFHELMQKKGCENARLWRFWADAPTTTMQRIKGLTTGSLPTFIDLSKNFASSEITEDNILDQFIASGKNITFMGDDTWMNLFPGRFNKAFPYPSFDVKDLHLVDNGVIKHLIPEIQTEDWQLLIAHFLGVDHCGHRYGPFHPEMPLKLQQMNSVIEEVVQTIDNNTLLLVMGDHGMTHTGDHGGETFNEVNAALFAYNQAGKFKKCASVQPKDPLVNQVDIVPTISFLLGTAIPFANLGVAIGDMIPEDDLQIGAETPAGKSRTSEVFFSNAKQVHTYINAYQDISRSLPHTTHRILTRDFKELEIMFNSAENDEHLQQNLVNYIQTARQMCREVWAKFDVFSMLIGLTLSIILLTFNLHVVKPIFGTIFQTTIGAIVVLTCVSTLLSVLTSSTSCLAFSLLLCGVAFIICSGISVKYVWEVCKNWKMLDEIFPTFLLIMYFVSFTTNSFILNEDITTLYFVLSLIMCSTLSVLYGQYTTGTTKHANTEKNSNNFTTGNGADETKFSSKLVHRRRNSKSHSNEKTHQSKTPYIRQNHVNILLLSSGALLSARLALYFRYCRAEQFWCFNDDSTEENQSSTGYDTTRVLLSCVSLAGTVWLFTWNLRKSGNLKNSIAMNVFMCKRFLPIATGFVVVSWILLLVPQKDLATLPSWCIVFSPRLVYIVLTIFFIIHWMNPIYTTILYPDGFGNYAESHVKSTITQIYNDLKSKLNQQSNQDSAGNSTPVVFGLYTVLTASTVSLLLCFVILFCLLLGPDKSTSLSLWIVCSVAALEINSITMQQKSTSYVPWSSVILWGMISSYWWFATGHQASISSIQWDAAFVGFQGSHSNNIIPAVLVILNTFCMQILSTVSLPLLMLWPRTKSRWYFNYEEQNEEEFTSELLFYKDQDKFFDVVKDLFLKNFGFHIAKIVGCMVCTCLHRRHLMVWWIFAPRYMFEGVSLIMIMLSSVFSYAHICNAGKKLGTWLRSVEESLD